MTKIPYDNSKESRVSIDSLTSNWNTTDKINADTYKIMLPIQKCRLSIRKNKKQNIVNSWNQQYWNFHDLLSNYTDFFRVFYQTIQTFSKSYCQTILTFQCSYQTIMTFTDLQSNNTDFSVFISNNNDTFTELKSHNTDFSVFISTNTGNFLRVTVNQDWQFFRFHLKQ